MNKFLSVFIFSFASLNLCSSGAAPSSRAFSVTNTKSSLRQQAIALEKKESIREEEPTLIFDVSRLIIVPPCFIGWTSSPDKVVSDRAREYVIQFCKKRETQDLFERFEQGGEITKIFAFINDAKNPSTNPLIQKVCADFGGVDPTTSLFLILTDGSERVSLMHN